MGAIGGIGFFVALLVVILIHEAAHFTVAKRFGFKVDEFFVGFGPRIWSFRRGETEYGIKAIPAGGYVRIAGMAPGEVIAPEDRHRTYGAKPIWQRALVIVAGPLTHFALAYLVFAGWLGLVGAPTPVSPLVSQVVVEMGDAPSPASIAGIRAGDRIVGIGGVEAPTDAEVVEITRANVGNPLPVVVDRDGERLTFSVTPVLVEVDGESAGRLGVVLARAREPLPPLTAVVEGGRLLGGAIAGTVGSLGDVFGPDGIARVAELLFTDAPREVTDPASIVGISQFAGAAAEAGRFADLAYVFALVNVFIGLLNLVPLPPFDGGHVALLAIEKVRGRAVDARRVVPIAALVATFLLVFTLSVVWLDLVKPLDVIP